MSEWITKKIWNIRNPVPETQLKLSQSLGIHPVMAQVLINRQLSDAQQVEEFFSADVSALWDPFLLTDMSTAVRRIQLARERNESVLIFGDYDVDGITSSALLYRALKDLGLRVTHHIPHRLHDGYGLNRDIGREAQAQGVSLLIAVDCGISAHEEVDHLRALGIEVIIVDHHETVGEALPAAVAVINPKRSDCPYPFKDLAAVGLVAKLVHALEGKFPEDQLDLICLGTIADVVPLRGENRILVKAGLPRIRETKNKGLAALIEVARVKTKAFRPQTVGFILGPRLNAAGRMDSAQKSLELLLCDDDAQARDLAQFLESSNIRRQKLQKDVIEEALVQIEAEVNFKDEKVIVLSKEGWHKGVLGIVASRVSDMYYRPAVVISLSDGIGTASARSIEGFHLHDALTHCAQILENFGGHKLAAGLTIRQENINHFRKLINEFAGTMLKVRDLVPSLDIDQEIPLSSLSLDLAETLVALEPFGEGNPVPVFCSRGLVVKSHPAVMGRETLKFWVTDGETTVSAVGFGMAKYRDLVRLGQTVDLAYEISIDDWNKAPTVQLQLKDIKQCQGE